MELVAMKKARVSIEEEARGISSLFGRLAYISRRGADEKGSLEELERDTLSRLLLLPLRDQWADFERFLSTSGVSSADAFSRWTTFGPYKSLLTARVRLAEAAHLFMNVSLLIAVYGKDENRFGHPFTVREREFICLLLEGKSDKEMANELRLSLRTIRFHISNIFNKLDVSKRVELELALLRKSTMIGSNT
jgi:DNA-binding CsgD family transcriptional regulator